MLGVSTNYDSILQVVLQWSPSQRIALIRALLDTLEATPAKILTHLNAPNITQIATQSITQNGMYSLHDEIDEAEWLLAAARNPAFADLHDPIEDIYSLADGKPFHDSI